MEVIVVIEKLLPSRQYTKRDGTIAYIHSFVGKTTKGQYDRDMVFEVMNDDHWAKMAIQVGKTYNVSFEPESRMWNSPTKGEMWFTSLKAWNADLIESQAAPQAEVMPQPAQQPQPTPTFPTELPF